MRVLFIFVTTVLFPSCGAAGWFGPSTYEECILNNIKGAKSDHAAKLVAHACREKFPDKNPIIYVEDVLPAVVIRDLSPEEVANVSGESPPKQPYSTSLVGDIYNGNTGVTISNVTIDVSGTYNGLKTTRTYTTDLSIPPQQIKYIKISTMRHDDDGFSWKITGARGF